jgi:fructose/tagatose bisphosphate aldolase
MAAIVSIGSIASARVQADSRFASTNVLINAERAATRLLAEAKMQAPLCVPEVPTKPRDVVEAALSEMGRQTSLRLAATAKESVEKIQRDAEAAIKVLRETGAIAIREVQALAANVAGQTKHDAKLAAEKLNEYRKSTRTPHEAICEGEDVAEIVVKAAQEASANLQEAIKTALAKINTITDETCAAVHEAALAAERKILDDLDRALARLKEALRASR